MHKHYNNLYFILSAKKKQQKVPVKTLKRLVSKLRIEFQWMFSPSTNVSGFLSQVVLYKLKQKKL